MFIDSRMRPRIACTAVIGLATALLQSGAAAADPSQDDQFLAVLQSKEIPAMENTATVVAAGHTVCDKLDDGVPASEILDGLRNVAYGMNPQLHEESERLSVTMGRFITAAVEVYCPGDQNKIASLQVNRVRQITEAAHRFTVAAYRTADERIDRLPADGHTTLLDSSAGTPAVGDITEPKPPLVPSPPKAKLPRPPRVITQPSAPRQSPPPQIQPPAESLPPPPPQAPEQSPAPQNQLPPEVPHPGSGPDGADAGGPGDGNGSGGEGGGPAEPPVQPRPPGMIQLVPW